MKGEARVRCAAARGPSCRRPPGKRRAAMEGAGIRLAAASEGGAPAPPRTWREVFDASRIVARLGLDRRACALLPLSADFSRAGTSTSENRVSAATPAPPGGKRAVSVVCDGAASADGARAGRAEKGPRHARGLGGKEAEIVSLLLHTDVRMRGPTRPERAPDAADLAAQLRPDGSSRAKKSRAAAAGSPESASAPSSGSQSSGRCSR